MDTEQKFEEFFEQTVGEDLECNYSLSTEYNPDEEVMYVSLVTEDTIKPELGESLEKIRRKLGHDKVKVKGDYQFEDRIYGIRVEKIT